MRISTLVRNPATPLALPFTPATMHLPLRPTLPRFLALSLLAVAAALTAVAAYTPPASPRATFNFNPGWKFLFGDQPGADQPGFDDSAWASVSLPHTWNDVDTYRAHISHGGGDQTEKLGIGWYRKHFKLPPGADGNKVFLEFDGLRQAGRFYLNGQPIGLYENGVTAFGLDITKTAKFGGQDNVLAVQVDNRTTYKEAATGVGFEWNAKDFNPDFGGLNRDASLIVTGGIYQTLPLYENLKTSGVYIYPKNVDVKNHSTDLAVEAEVRNETGGTPLVSLSTVVVDASGTVQAEFNGTSTPLAAGQTATLQAAGTLAHAHLWDTTNPYLYDVYSILSVGGQVVDVCKTQTGFRKAEYLGGAGTGGVHLNDHFVWLTGYSQRSADDWPGLGGAYPDWMHDLTIAYVRASHGNYIRWMHVSPERADVAACDKFGVAIVCPAGDKEKDATGRQWDQRAEVMRDSMIFFRNNPSILFWEVGNTGVSVEQMVQIVNLRKQWDPNGGRAVGTRDGGGFDAALTPVSEFYGVMIGQDTRTDAVTRPGQLFRGYSVERRDKAPLIETEDYRDEAARGIWDDYSPPTFGFHPKNLASGDPKAGQDSYNLNSETFALGGAGRYVGYARNRIDNPDPLHSKWAAYASIYFTDSDADGRQDGSEVLRVSGKMDGVRLPKELYYVSRVMQSDTPDLHIIGHWSYPANTVKTMYVAANHCQSVELFLNGQSLGVSSRPTNGYIFEFPKVAFQPGVLKAVAMANGQAVAQQELTTAGPPSALKLTVHSAPEGLQADGSDVVLVDFEAVDAHGNRCPTDEARVDFKCDGPAIWRGGFCSDKLNTTNNLFLDTECGINRVAIRSTTTPGTITLTATRAGLAPATVTIESHPVPIRDGLTPVMPPRLPLATTEAKL